jgi:hypothetical protein
MYTTAQGRKVNFPYAIAAKLVVDCSDDVKQVVSDMHQMFTELQNLDREISILRGENMRLKHENEFMLRMVNERDA